MKAYKENRNTDVLIVCLVTRCICVWSKGSLRFVPGERAPFAKWIREWMCPRLGLDILGRKKCMAPAENITMIFFIVRLVDVVCVNMCNDTYTSFYPLPIALVGRLIWLMKINLFLDVTHSARSLKDALQGVALAAGTELQNCTVKLCFSVCNSTLPHLHKYVYTAMLCFSVCNSSL
jgi:hypothetical protein